MAFPLFLALKYLKPKRSFTSVVIVVSVLGVVLGVAIVIIVRAVMTGFGDTWREKILEFKPHLAVFSPDSVIDDASDLCDRIEVIPGVLATSPSAEMRVLAEHDRRITAPIVMGVDPERTTRLLPQMTHSIVDGCFDLSGDQAAIGIDLARNLDASVGDTILVYSPLTLIGKDEIYLPEELVVSGIYEMGHNEFDSGFVVTSLGVVRDLLAMEGDTAYSVQIKVASPDDPAAFAATREAVEACLGDFAPHLQVRSWQEIDSQLFSVLAVEKNMMVILLMFITIVAIFCVMNTLIVVTVQKTDEIGLLKALGFSSWQILCTFVLHGWIQCIVGTGLGIGLAVLVLRNLHNIVAFLATMGLDVFPKNIYGLAEIPWRIVPGEVAQVAAMVIFFCTLASIVPAWRAASMDPVKALRRE
ncbi:MAG: ABC transporter permease [Kiritimatiellia bacterium]|jgi:lipoprotein-releasing system permease protein